MISKSIPTEQVEKGLVIKDSADEPYTEMILKSFVFAQVHLTRLQIVERFHDRPAPVVTTAAMNNNAFVRQKVRKRRKIRRKNH